MTRCRTCGQTLPAGGALQVNPMTIMDDLEVWGAYPSGGRVTEKIRVIVAEANGHETAKVSTRHRRVPKLRKDVYSQWSTRR